jgi:hypothetical protein
VLFLLPNYSFILVQAAQFASLALGSFRPLD